MSCYNLIFLNIIVQIYHLASSYKEFHQAIESIRLSFFSHGSGGVGDKECPAGEHDAYGDAGHLCPEDAARDSILDQECPYHPEDIGQSQLGGASVPEPPLLPPQASTALPYPAAHFQFNPPTQLNDAYYARAPPTTTADATTSAGLNLATNPPPHAVPHTRIPAPTISSTAIPLGNPAVHDDCLECTVIPVAPSSLVPIAEQIAANLPIPPPPEPGTMPMACFPCLSSSKRHAVFMGNDCLDLIKLPVPPPPEPEGTDDDDDFFPPVCPPPPRPRDICEKVCRCYYCEALNRGKAAANHDASAARDKLRLKHANKKKKKKEKGPKKEDGRDVEDLLSFIEGTPSDKSSSSNDQTEKPEDPSNLVQPTVKSTKAAKRERQRKRRQEEKERLRFEKEEASRQQELERAIQTAAKSVDVSKNTAKEQARSDKKDKQKVHVQNTESKVPPLASISQSKEEVVDAMNLSPTKLDDLFSK